jgi:hypothetical protein
MVILFSRLQIASTAKQFRLLVIRSTEVVKTIGIPRLAIEGTLKGIYGAEVVALLIELYPFAGIRA